MTDLPEDPNPYQSPKQRSSPKLRQSVLWVIAIPLAVLGLAAMVTTCASIMMMP